MLIIFLSWFVLIPQHDLRQMFGDVKVKKICPNKEILKIFIWILILFLGKKTD